MNQRYKEDDFEFQDFVVETLWRDGFGTYLHESRFRQRIDGEGPVVEVKHDHQWRETGNFYIETSEQRVGDFEYKSSGIHHSHKTWLWAIGDPEEFFIVSKRYLIDAESHCESAEAKRRDDTPTRGFKLPVIWVRLASLRSYRRGKAVVLPEQSRSKIVKDSMP